jgi:hypothetical protein
LGPPYFQNPHQQNLAVDTQHYWANGPTFPDPGIHLAREYSTLASMHLAIPQTLFFLELEPNNL